MFKTPPFPKRRTIDNAVHIFTQLLDGESVYLCGAPSATAAVALGWADKFYDADLCPECLKIYRLKLPLTSVLSPVLL